MALVARALSRPALDTVFVAGSGDLVSATLARAKTDALREILQRHFHDTSAYDGHSDIGQQDVKTAIKYARSKKLTKSNRKAVKGGIKMAGFVAGAATGATVGSIVPVAGTVAGGALGGVAVGSAVSASVTVLDQFKRKTKGLYKYIKGTRGEHRSQCAECLYYGATMLADNDPKHQAALEALYVILDEEAEEVLALPYAACVNRIAERLKSN